VPAATLLCLVVAIADGDTLTARCGEPGAYEQVKVRLAEVDAPEAKQPFGNVSRQSLAELCFQQTAAIRTEKKDRYGRSVARVECQGKDASAHQVATGMAWAFTRYLTDPEIARLQHAARAAGLGLWSEAGAVAPWEWRRR
jgi:endonuclease YncB( thermonuclease family)